MASMRSSFSTGGLAVWDLCHMFSVEKINLPMPQARHSMTPGRKSQHSSSRASPSNTVHNTSSLSFSAVTVREVTPPPALSLGEREREKKRDYYITATNRGK